MSNNVKCGAPGCGKAGATLTVHDSRPGGISGTYHPDCYTELHAAAIFAKHFPAVAATRHRHDDAETVQGAS